MKLHSYLGGINIKPRRELSKNGNIVSVVPKGDMIYPLIPYMKKCPLPNVSIGDRVKIGTQIAEAEDGTMGIYSSVSGIVKAIEERENSDLSKYKSIIIENDGMFEEDEFDEVVDLEQLNYKQIKNLIGVYGIREYNKENIPLYEKLNYTEKNKIEYVIINAVECEPYFTTIYRRLVDDSELVVDGIRVMKHIFPKAKIILAIGDDKMDAVIEMEKCTKMEPNVNVVVIPNKYPSGEACRLIYQITGKAFKNEKQAIANGIFSIQTDTLCAVSNAVFEGVPPLSRVVTVSGDEAKNPGNYEVLFGTTVAELIELTGGENNESYMIVAGGPMTGYVLENLNVPVTSAVEGVLLMSAEEAPVYEPSDCIKCGRCVNVCPNRLVPAKLLEYAKSGNTDKFRKWHGTDCMLCGCCTFICPSHLPVTGYIEQMKKQLTIR